MRSIANGLIAVLLASAWLVLVDRVIASIPSGAGEQGLGWLSTLTLAGGEGIASGLCAAVALALWISGRCVHALSRQRIPPPWTMGLGAGVLAAWGFHWVGAELSAGDWIAQQSFAWVFAWGPAVVGGLGIGSFTWLVSRSPSDQEGAACKSWAFTAAIAAGSVVCGGLNAALFFGLYPRFHLALSALSVLAAFAAMMRATATVTRRWSLRTLAWVAVPCLALSVLTGSFWLRIDRTVRSELTAKSIVSTDAIRTFATIAADRGLLHEVLDHLRVGETALGARSDLPRGLIEIPDDWNVVLIVSDAMRADALPPVRRGGQTHARKGDTPFLDRWLDGSYRFRFAYAQGPRTERSMPPFFRSLEANENPMKIGQPLAATMRDLGRTPVAVVNNLFVEPRRRRFNALLEGFEPISVYEKDAMHSAVPRALRVLRETTERPFFAWIHLFCLHAPGFADNRLLGRKDGSAKARYRLSLQWMDRQFAKLMAGMQNLGLADNTVVILASDHGENLGDNRIETHGPRVWEESIRVPLAFRIPGYPGRLVEDAVVGNIDIVPTIGDLLGAPVDPRHRGTSLVPLMVGDVREWKDEYYAESNKGEFAALIRGRQKVIYDFAGDSVYRFDLEADPTEDRNVFDPDGWIDQRLLRGILFRSPRHFRQELDDEATRNLLAARLAEVDPRAPGEELPFLLRLAAFDASGRAREEAIRIFEEASDQRVSLLVVEALFATGRRYWGSELKKMIEQLSGSREETELVRGLALQGQPPFSERLIGERMQWWVDHADGAAWEPWLQLIENWPRKIESNFAPPLIAILKREAEASPRLLELALDNIASLALSRASRLRSDLVLAVTPYLRHRDVSVRAAACRALGTVGAENSARLLREQLQVDRRAIRVRQAALQAIAKIEGERAVALVVELGKDPLLTFDAIKILRRLKSEAGLPFLREVSENHYNRITRDAAARAIETMKDERGARRQAPAPTGR
jgi:hypothetical protein